MRRLGGCGTGLAEAVMERKWWERDGVGGERVEAENVTAVTLRQAAVGGWEWLEN